LWLTFTMIRKDDPLTLLMIICNVNISGDMKHISVPLIVCVILMIIKIMTLSLMVNVNDSYFVEGQ
jgi:hypothetical protein